MALFNGSEQAHCPVSMPLRLLRLFSAENEWETRKENQVVEDVHGSDVLWYVVLYNLRS